MDSFKLPMNSAIVAELQAIVGPRNVLSRRKTWHSTNTMGRWTALDRGRVFPFSTEDVSRIVKLAVKHDVPMSTGAGTGLSGGALARVAA